MEPGSEDRALLGCGPHRKNPLDRPPGRGDEEPVQLDLPRTRRTLFKYFWDPRGG
jgi:hypothetical protein